MTEIQKKPKYRPQPGMEIQDQLINFELTQQNTLTSWNQKIIKHQFRSKTPGTNLHNDDDLVYSDNQNEEDHHEEFVNKKYSLPNNNLNDQKIFVEKINMTVDTRKIKTQYESNEEEKDMRASWFKLEKSRKKTDEAERRLNQNKSSCLLINKSVFFRNNTKPISSAIVFRVKPRPDIKQLAQNAFKTERKKQ